MYHIAPHIRFIIKGNYFGKMKNKFFELLNIQKRFSYLIISLKLEETFKKPIHLANGQIKSQLSEF